MTNANTDVCSHRKTHTHMCASMHTFILYNFIWKLLLKHTGDKVKCCVEEVRRSSQFPT